MLSYKDIFDIRGSLYHKAMESYPDARDEEFALLLKILNPKKSQKIADIPSGGDYLKKRVPDSIKVFSIDPSKEFARKDTNIIQTPVNNTFFQDSFLDGVFSLAGLHHMQNRSSFYREMYRVLKDEGTLAIADVGRYSKVGNFLNSFINSVNPLGHKGFFLGLHDVALLEKIGFCVTYEKIQFHWKFHNTKQMAEFCMLLFGARCTEYDMLQGLADFLGFDTVKNNVFLKWELFFIKAKK